MVVRLEPGWRRALEGELAEGYFADLTSFVDGAYAAGPCYPPEELVFRAFEQTPFDRVRAVILGQDPYHEPGQAQGLAFYVPPGIRTPPSLANIARELAADLPDRAPLPGQVPNLLSWADQGVLLLNATLTVAAHAAASHQRRGWERFTDAAIRALAEGRENLVFLLWGAPAQKKAAFVDRSRHCVIESAHPSPLSAYRGFFGSRPFSRANDYLVAHGQPPIAW